MKKIIVFIYFIFSLFIGFIHTSAFAQNVNPITGNINEDRFEDYLGSIKISGDESSCRNSKTISASENILYFVWDGIHNEKRKIFFREMISDKFSEVMILDPDPHSENSEPEITVDEKGNPHIVWVSKINEVSLLYYAYREKGRWIFLSNIYQTSNKNIESPVIGIKPDGNTVFLAWQAGKGINYNIFSAIKNISDNWAIYKLSIDSDKHYNLYPQIFMNPSTSVFWYESTDSGFILMGLKYDENMKIWNQADLDGLGKMAFKRLPVIMMDNTSKLAGVWYDSLNSLDKIFLGIQNYKEGIGIQVNKNSPFNESQPFGIFAGDRSIYLTFLNADENQVYFNLGILENQNVKFLDSSVRVSNAKPGFYSNPRITLAQNKIIIVWCSDLKGGGDGAVYIKIIKVLNV